MNRRNFLGAAPAGMLLALGANQISASAQAPGPAAAATLPASDGDRISELVDANHILADQKIVDGFGHISVRSAADPKHYFMARSRAPTDVTRDDILEFDENSQPIDARGRELYGERFIHGEIYRVRPDVMSVMHGHTPALLPFGVTKTPLKAMIHVGYFLGTEPAPVFEIREAMGEQNLMLVNSAKAGAALARTLGNHSVVLLRGHGVAVAAPSIRDAVFRAIYTKVNAEAELEALRLGQPVFMNRYEVTRVEPVSRQWDQWVAESRASHASR